ncbi:MAG TPA: gamma-glutamyltransferase [Candidatus Acidoferrales bacterium]|jgi:gamma-glutamyltranspeptidase/glutathione hydrolase|nr:gamma-glutamyltransferase [Candidatus Acidoferrales bacterium]
MRVLMCLFMLWCLALQPALTQDRDYGRSMVVTGRGIVATSQVLASQAGAHILERGGSAIDAAIAANAVLGVTEPMMNGIGGDLFLLYWDAKSGKLYGLNASGWAPQGLTIDFLKKQGITSMPDDGIHSVTVPGAVDGWAKAHQRFGRLPWKDLFTPAIYYAEHGYSVPEIIHDFWGIGRAKLKQTEEAQRVFLPNGKPPAVGEQFSNPDLGKALRLLADRGPREFYEGEIAKAILKTSNALGGTMGPGDLAEFSSEWVEPISIDYRGWRVYELPPNGQGMAALEMLNIMAASQPDNHGPEGAVELHKKIEAMKLAYTDLYRYNGDPRFASIPVPGLLSKQYAAQRAALIDPQKANCAAANGTPAKSDTTYLAAVDKEGNIASLIQSVYDYFGSGVAVTGMGFLLQDRGGLFVLDPKHPDALAPHKRPFHTIIPAFMEQGDQHIGFGIMGGSNQPLAHAQFVSNLVDYGWNIQAALSAPRFTIRDTGKPIQCTILLESRVSPEVQNQLRQKGHDLVLRKDYSALMGRGQAVLHNSATGTNFAASDPRADGSAEPEAMPKE